MNSEYETKAWVNGKLVPVTATFELDGYKPLIYGIFDPLENDITELIHPDEFDRIYLEIMTKTQEDAIGIAESFMDERKDNEGLR